MSIAEIRARQNTVGPDVLKSRAVAEWRARLRAYRAGCHGG